MFVQASPKPADCLATPLEDAGATVPRCGDRAQVAARFHRVRARYNALPEHIRRVIRLTLERDCGPRTTEGMSALIRQVAAEHGAAPSDFGDLSEEHRTAMTAELNDQARQDAPWTRCTRAFSPQAVDWLAASSSSRAMQVWRAIAGHSDFRSDTDPAGDRSSGVVTVEGVSLRFQVLYRRPKSNLECPTPWNADLSRRVLFVSIEGEFAFYNDEAEA